MSQVKAIYARTENGVMGKNNKLPWNVPADLHRFKRLTSGCIVVMGYNTWLSLGSKPLPNRINLVIGEKRDDSHLYGAMMHPTLESAVNTWRLDARTIWVIGGPALIAEAMRDYDAEVQRTTLGISPDGDTNSAEADRELANYARVGYEEFRCEHSGVPVVIERFVKAGVDAGTK